MDNSHSNDPQYQFMQRNLIGYDWQQVLCPAQVRVKKARETDFIAMLGVGIIICTHGFKAKRSPLAVIKV